jgi:hypothetical protein
MTLHDLNAGEPIIRIDAVTMTDRMQFVRPLSG